MAIPRILHQIYFQGWDALPDETRRAVNELRDMNPEWDYRFYDSTNAEDYISANYGPEMLSVFQRIDPSYHPARADLLRYLVCYRDGGIYLDVKSSTSSPFDDVIIPSDRYLLSQWSVYRDKPAGTQPFKELADIQGGEFVVWFIACEPRHPFLKAVIDSVVINIEGYDPFKHGVGKLSVLRLTGPIAYTLAIKPIQKIHEHRYVKYDDDLGFIVSIHGDHKSHERVYGKHYSLLVRPVVLQSRFITYACQVWYGVCKPSARYLGWKIDGARRRMHRFSRVGGR